MTSNDNKEAFIWIWLPDETKPVVAGRLEADKGKVYFNYGKSYLERIGDQPAAIPIYEPELPLQAGILPLPEGLTIPGLSSTFCAAIPTTMPATMLPSGTVRNSP
jgi:serine/threonine-protein kinase HipA